ncbi:ACT domain-containing protein [Acetivibrio mesophilus]|uniref:aspartate kinase n=1 Tax=Acetivibrio mesophilus TaxID=2487273 RepID=A0A4Q0I7F2_9FIRM|nr:ACT domain-containing protein [Acetivibrio mesophilus]ODM25188.1 amino acid-binding protein [Clostridium sp. Bc-iso-3]RXE59795.1 ACT domain-containing protein [Acetivibrio mesophilus]HHV29284.1 ACT domain-containing protein [Clostridium sp.]
MSQKLDANIDMSYGTALIMIRNIPDDMKLISGIFTSIADESINIQMISKTSPHKGHVNISFCLPSEDLSRALIAINRYRKSAKDLLIEVDAYNTKVSVSCGKMKDIPGFAAKLFKIFADEGIDIKLATASESEISCLVHDYHSDRIASLVI